MKILHINFSDVGGAATACRRIHLGLLEKGIDSKILLLYKTKNVAQTFKFQQATLPVKPIEKKPLYKRVINKLFGNKTQPDRAKEMTSLDKVNAFKKLKKEAEDFSFTVTPYDITQSPLYQEADIIQINWASGFINEETFFTNNTKPVVWRMPDLYPCGGGYHYEKGFPFDNFKEEMAFNIDVRKKSIPGKNITFVPISHWVKQKANESSLIVDFPKKLIHNGVNTKLFKPHDKIFARGVFNIPDDKIVFLFGSDSALSKRKGFDILKEALAALDASNIQLVAFGQNHNPLNGHYMSVGEIRDELLLPVLYSAADFFIMPSTEEAFGQVTIEALACGTPVVSFPNGGSIDIIKTGFNGVLAEGFTAIDLKNAINQALRIDFNKKKIIEDVKERFNITDKVDEYISLYKSILNK